MSGPGIPLTSYALVRILPRMVEVLVTDEFSDWYMALAKTDSAAVDRVVGLLEVQGIQLGSPYTSGGKPLRVFYAFDPQRQAVLLIGGDKSGDDRFYEVFVPRAERLWEEYLDETKEDTT